MVRSLADRPHLNQRSRCCRARWSSTSAPTPRARSGSATSARCCRATTRTGGRTPSPRRRSAKLAILQFFLQIFQIFGGLVLGCIKTKFCKKICVRQHFSSSTRFAFFFTAAISKFSQKIGLKNCEFRKISENFRKIWQIILLIF